MTLRARLALGMAAIILLLIAPLGFALHSLREINGVVRDLRGTDFVASLLLGRIRSGVEEVRQREIELYSLPQHPDVLPNFLRAIDTLSVKADSLRRYDLRVVAEQVQSGLARLRALGPVELEAAKTDLRRGTAHADSLAAQQVRPAINYVVGSIQRAETSLSRVTTDRVEAAGDLIAKSNVAALTALGAALFLATAIAIWLAVSISRPVRDLERGMRAVAMGDFGHRLELPEGRDDEFGHLSASFHSMSRQLAQLDKMKAEFVSIASHELKTPINVILGYLQLLQEDVYGPLSARQREVCVTLVSQAQALSRLVRHLLDVSRFEAGAGRIEPREMNLAAFLWELESAFRVLALQRGVSFQVERDEDLPVSVVWDEDRINEVLGNLLSNAFKFTERGGRVTLSLRAEDDAVRIEVTDTGAGIPPEQLPRVFDKFYQADNQLAAAAKGSGLGLAIAKTIVTAHHGTIEVESTVGVGTTFRLRLPVLAAARRATDATHAHIGAGVS